MNAISLFQLHTFLLLLKSIWHIHVDIDVFFCVWSHMSEWMLGKIESSAIYYYYYFVIMLFTVCQDDMILCDSKCIHNKKLINNILLCTKYQSHWLMHINYISNKTSLDQLILSPNRELSQGHSSARATNQFTV